MKKKIGYLLMICVLLFSPISGGAQGMLTEKPYFTALIQTEGCKFEIHINGVIVLFNYFGNPGKVELPINHWLQTGKNDFKIICWFLKEDPKGLKAKIDMKVQVRTSGEPSSENMFIGSINLMADNTALSSPYGKFDSQNRFIPKQDGDVTISKIESQPITGRPGVEVSRAITMLTPFPVWGFLKGEYAVSPEAILNNELAGEMKTKIYPVYEKIQDALLKKDIDSILPMFDERNKETDIAFYYEPGKTQKDILDNLKEAVNNPDRELLVYKPINLTVFLSPNRRLIRLARPDDGGGAIVFNFKDRSTHEAYDIVLRKQGDKWVITR